MEVLVLFSLFLLFGAGTSSSRDGSFATNDPEFMAFLAGIDQNYSYIEGNTAVCYGADMCITGICQVYTEIAVGVMMYSFGSCAVTGQYKGPLDMFMVGAASDMNWVNATENECFDQKGCFSYACNTQAAIGEVKSIFIIPLEIDC
jgi:hypothetical protein